MEETNMSRASSFALEYPFVTKSVLALCVSVHVLMHAVALDLLQVCMMKTKIMEVHRLLIAPFVHGGIFHLLLNMVALCSIVSRVERLKGSVWTALVLGLALIMGSVLFSIASLFFAPTCAVGLSGVLFSMLVIQLSVLRVEAVPFLVFQAPPLLYPFLLLVLTQLILPHISFLGHLVGIVVGHLILLFNEHVGLPQLKAESLSNLMPGFQEPHPEGFQVEAPQRSSTWASLRSMYAEWRGSEESAPEQVSEEEDLQESLRTLMGMGLSGTLPWQHSTKEEVWREPSSCS